MRRSTSKGLTYHISKFRSEREGVHTFNIIIKYRKYCHGIMCKFSWLELHNEYALHKSQSTARVASGVPGDSRGTSWARRVPIQTPAGNRHLPSTCYIIDVLWERMISSEHDGWSRHIQLFGDTNSRRRINQLPP